MTISNKIPGIIYDFIFSSEFIISHYPGHTSLATLSVVRNWISYVVSIESSFDGLDW